MQLVHLHLQLYSLPVDLEFTPFQKKLYNTFPTYITAPPVIIKAVKVIGI